MMCTDEFGGISEVFIHEDIHTTFLKQGLLYKALTKNHHEEKQTWWVFVEKLVWKSAWFHSVLSLEFSSGRVRLFVFLCDGQIYTKLYDFPSPKICFFVLRAHMANSLLKQVLCNKAHSIK